MLLKFHGRKTPGYIVCSLTGHHRPSLTICDELERYRDRFTAAMQLFSLKTSMNRKNNFPTRTRFHIFRSHNISSEASAGFPTVDR